MRSVQSTLFALLAASTAYADTTLNLTQGVSPISHDVYELHMIVFWICVVIGIVVFGAMFYSILFHRKSKGVKPADFHSHTWLEIGWTIVPVIILVLMAIPATKVLLNMNNNDQEDLTIKVTGYQWKWHYEYIEDGISFFSNLATPMAQMKNEVPKTADYLRAVDHPLVVPIHKKIRFLITSNDVNHAWWVPDFAIKRDAVSGFINEAWVRVDKPGTYQGQCAELCGVNHAFMPIVVIALTEQGYKDWVAKQKGEVSQGEAETNRAWTLQELMKKGEATYGHICAACHQPSGAGLPPTFPALKGSKIALGPIANHINTVFNGVSGTAMQAFKNQLSDVELAAVITYERNAWGNDTKSLVQPIQIKALRDGQTMEAALATKPIPADMMPKAASNAVTPKTNTPPASEPAPATKAPAAAVVPTLTEQTAVTNAAPSAVTSVPPLDPVAAMKAAMERGEKIYMNTCAVCHQPAGTGLPPTFPALKGSPIVMGVVAEHIHRVLFGKAGTAMQAFKDQMNDQDLADVITYERNAWGNNKGELVKSEDIKAAREQSEKH